MEGRVGRGVITLFLGLVVLSALLFIFFENNRIGPLAQATDIAAAPELVETTDPWAFTDVMTDYDFDLYRKTDRDGYAYVAPPALDYTDPSTLDRLALRELGVATDEIDPASRETTIILSLARKPGTAPSPTPLPGSATPTPVPMSLGQFGSLTYFLVPATKTVILDGGASTATVQIMPDVCDAYVAVRTPEGNIVFVTTFSNVKLAYSKKPVPIVRNSMINRVKGNIFIFKMTSLNFPGHYKIYAVMTPPGANVWDSRNWISNLATIRMNYGIVAE